MLLYIHVPFCRSKCLYCAFYSIRLEPEPGELLKQYTDTLVQEMSFWAERLGRIALDSIFFGGGTPSLLPPLLLGRILDKAAKLFSLDSHTEITLEANPESASLHDWAAAVKTAGANRLSLGVQSFSPETLRLLGRRHSLTQSLLAVEKASAAGFSRLSLDLMWGLPGHGQSQTVREWLQTLRQAVSLKPSHLSCYCLSLEANVPLHSACAQGVLQLPEEKCLRSLFLEGSAYLREQGYAHYELANYALDGQQCRHNLGYWTQQDYLGLGPSAVSFLGGERWTNPQDFSQWQKAVQSGQSGPSGACLHERLSPDLQRKERLMLALRTAQGLQSSWLRSAVPSAARFLEDLQNTGLGREKDGRFALTPEGWLVCDTIISRFFDFF